MVLAPVVRGRKGEYGKLLEEMRAQGYARAVVDGELRRLDEEIELDKKFKHDISIVVDRLVMKEGLRKRLAESIEAASQLAEGLVEVELIDGAGRPGADAVARARRCCRGPSAGKRGEVLVFSEKFACLNCGTSMPELEPRIFSFNSPHGCLRALPRARLPAGDRPRADRPRPDALDLRGRARAVDEGGLDLPPAPARGGRRGERHRRRRRPGRTCPTRDRELLLEGTGDERHTITYRNRFGRRRQLHGPLRRHARTASSAATRTPTRRTPASGSSR